MEEVWGKDPRSSRNTSQTLCVKQRQTGARPQRAPRTEATGAEALFPEAKHRRSLGGRGSLSKLCWVNPDLQNHPNGATAARASPPLSSSEKTDVQTPNSRKQQHPILTAHGSVPSYQPAQDQPWARTEDPRSQSLCTSVAFHRNDAQH